jgi:hypothetical protein
MDRRLTSLEKAFELARSGNCPSLGYLVKKLKSERYDTMHLEGKSLRRQLAQLIEESALHKVEL